MSKRNKPVNLEHPLKIEKLISGGYGLATRTDGKKVLLLNALPNESVTAYEPTKIKSSYEEGIATKFTTTSPHRIAPKDVCYLSTSPFQIMDYACELESKRDILAEIFRNQIESEKIPLPITDNRDFFYRNKMEYSLFFDHSDQKIHLAFHKRGTHQKIPIASSSLERPEIFTAAQSIVDSLNEKKADSRKYQSLLLRCDQSGKVSGGLYENHQPHPDFENLTDKIFGHEYSYSPNGFFQINLPVYELALKAIADHVKTAHILDLYSGVGTIGLSIAHLLEKPVIAPEASTNSQSPTTRQSDSIDLTLVESNASAYRELEQNCTNRKNARPIYSPSESALDEVKPDATVIVDPPRAGLDVKLINRFLDVKPPTIIYLSCNPVTQARDVERLASAYRISFLQPYNFFPRTPHLENLIVLEKR